MSKASIAAAKCSLQYLESLQSWQLKHLCSATGISVGSKKSATAAALTTNLTQQDRSGKESCNIKSVDMGVKNLAYCLLQPLTASTSSGPRFRIKDWRRMNVLTGDTTASDVDEVKDDATTTASMYSPANLSPIAARLAARLATDHNPAYVLIERQRFRSMGGASVQEWTLRVNSLEAMLWACLATLRTSADAAFPATVEMSPARIAAYWNSRGTDWSLDAAEETVPSEKVKTDQEQAKRGMEKAEKIAIVRHWLETGVVDVDQPAQGVANAFMAIGRTKKVDGDLAISKKDDLADCVVQGVTFGLWLENRRLLGKHLEQQLEI